MSDVPPPTLTGLGCGHRFCTPCWADLLTTRVDSEGGDCLGSPCPETGCGERVPLGLVDAVAPPRVASAWRRFGLQRYVSVSKDKAWCPGPGCSAVFLATVPVSRLHAASCTECRASFCFECSGEGHVPATCKTVSTWKDKCASESETVNWMLLNTKKCPACSVRIEKNQGCNHMRCSSKGCGIEFCWMCLGLWKDHGANSGGYYSCNKFGGAAAPAGGSLANAKAELERYMWHMTVGVGVGRAEGYPAIAIPSDFTHSPHLTPSPSGTTGTTRRPCSRPSSAPRPRRRLWRSRPRGSRTWTPRSSRR